MLFNDLFYVLSEGKPFEKRFKKARQIVKNSFESGVRNRLVGRMIDWAISKGMSKKYMSFDRPLYKNDKFLRILLKRLTNNAGPIFREMLAKSPDTVAKSLFLSMFSHAKKRRSVLKKLGHCPFVFVLNPTNACNRNCEICYMGSGKVGKHKSYPLRTINAKQMKEIIKQMKKHYGSITIIFIGGEPTLMWKDIVEALKENPDVLAILYTNNDIIGNEKTGKKVLNEFLKVGNVAIGNSFEGSHQYTDKVRGSNAYGNAMRAIKWQKEKGLFFGPSVTPTNDNIDYLISDEFFDSIKEMGSRFIFYYACIPLGPKPKESLKCSLSAKNRLKLIEAKARLVLKGDSILPVNFWNDESFVGGCMAGKSLINFSPPHLPKKEIEKHVKKFGYSEKDILTSIMPCVFLQGIAGYLMKDFKVIGKEKVYDNIYDFFENEPVMIELREGFKKDLTKRMRAGEHWITCAPCVFYDWPKEGLMKFVNKFIAMQPTFKVHDNLLDDIIKSSNKYKKYLLKEYPLMVERLNNDFSLGLKKYVSWQKKLCDEVLRKMR